VNSVSASGCVGVQITQGGSLPGGSPSFFLSLARQQSDDGVGNVLYGTVAEIPCSYQCAEFSTVLCRESPSANPSVSVVVACPICEKWNFMEGSARIHSENRAAKVIDTS